LDILSAADDTPVVELRYMAPKGGARILVKMLSHNPTGSMKDRMVRSVVEGAIASGRLRTWGRIVEYTGGSTGTSLALVCDALTAKQST
jgi:cysteine synthase A